MTDFTDKELYLVRMTEILNRTVEYVMADGVVDDDEAVALFRIRDLCIARINEFVAEVTA